MKSYKTVLSEQIVVNGNIRSENSNIDNNLISEKIIKDLEKMVFEYPNFNYDIKTTYHAQHSWVYSLITEKIFLDHQIALNNHTTWSNVEGLNEISVKRNNIDLNKIEGNPHYTLVYIVKAGKNPGEFMLNYDTQHQKQLYYKFPIQEGNFYLFNSNIDYYLSKNYDEENRIYMTWTCHKR